MSCPKTLQRSFRTALMATCICGIAIGQTQPASRRTAVGDPEMHRAAKQGDLDVLQARLRAGSDPNARDVDGRTALLNAVAAGRLDAARLLLASGADVNGKSSEGRTALIEAAESGRLDAARLLVEAGADLNVNQRGSGAALDAADRAGHTELAAMLRQAGARSATGRSIGDTVCVRPWKGDGYCGTVESTTRTNYSIRITQIIGCANGCEGREQCSAGKQVGGVDGWKTGDLIQTVSWCLTHTGVQP